MMAGEKAGRDDQAFEPRFARARCQCGGKRNEPKCGGGAVRDHVICSRQLASTLARDRRGEWPSHVAANPRAHGPSIAKLANRHGCAIGGMHFESGPGQNPLAAKFQKANRGRHFMNMKHTFVCAAVLLAACTPPAPPASKVETPQPTEEMSATFANCQWGEVKGPGLSIWSYACPNDRLVADAALPGFQRERRDENGQTFRHPVIRIFTKPPGEQISAVQDAVRAASPGGETCEITPGSHGDFTLFPTGEAFTAYQQFVEGKADGPSMPCGPLGPSEAGGGYIFRALQGADDRVAAIDFGTEIAIFDADTLKAAPAAP